MRGFVPDGRLYVEAADFLRCDDALFRMAPEAVYLTLSFATGHLAEIARRPAMRRFHGLTLQDTLLFDTGPVAALAGSPYLGGLRTLDLRDTHLDDERLAIILASGAYPRLHDLDLSDSRLEQQWTLDGLHGLQAARFAPHLVSLAIGGRHLGDDVVDILAQLPRLERLDIHSSELTDAGLRALAALDHRYHYLDLARGAFTAAGAAALIAAPVAANLTYLNLSSNQLGDEGYASVADAITRSGLIDLDMSGSLSDPAGPATARALAHSTITNTLRRLNLSLAHFGADGATALAAAPWEGLESLDLYGNGIGDQGAAAIAASNSLHRLRFLDLGDNTITDAGALALARSPHLEALTVVELGGAELADTTVSVLRDRFGAGARLSYPWERRA
jgi:Leucine-rich repeat (LRR) protein